MRGRSWVFTLNNYTDEHVKQVESLDTLYTVYGKEVGASGTPHLQGFMYYKNQRTLSSIKKKLPTAHLEKMKGTHEQAIEYCKKDGDFVEIGQPPVGHKPKSADRIARNKRLRDTPFNDLLENGEITLHEVPVLKKARMILNNEVEAETAEGVRGVWIYGPPGTGKTHSARNEYPGTLYVKAQNKWFDGYAGEEIILLDDLDNNCLGHYMKIWADKWSCSGEIKGGTVPLRHKKFIVTSNYLPEELWREDDMMRRAIERRFEIVRKSIKYF